MQNTNRVFMVRPISFGFNAETAVNNYYQTNDKTISPEYIQQLALNEFNNFVKVLENEGVEVNVIEDTMEPHTPDSIFPNNWFSTHEENKLILYPMYAENRRLERTEKIFNEIKLEKNKVEILDLTNFENRNIFLEGTGSMVLDRSNKKAYVCLSERAHEEVLDYFCEKTGFKKIAFHAFQNHDIGRKPIYHTNVMMSIGEKYAIISLDTIDDIREREKVVNSLKEDGKEIIEISEEQVKNFLGNTLELNSKNGKICVMSKTAYLSLNENQKKAIEKYNKIVSVSIPTIEKYGGGSARCMLAELFI